jgi:hypothetical protein
MSFPVATSNGQTALVNGITYVWNASIGSWTRQQTYLGQLVVSATPPTTNSVGTQWYSTTEDVIYEWATNNGTNFFWLDVSSSAVVSNSALTPYITNTVSTIATTANVSVASYANTVTIPYISAQLNTQTSLAIANLSTTNVITTNTISANAIVLGANTANASLDLSAKTDAILLPAGTTAQRPTVPSSTTGIRYNTTLGVPEWYSAATSQWLPLYQSPSYTLSYLVVAGGGGGGRYYSGGGGAGGLISGSLVVASGTTYSIIVGAGGPGNTTTSPGTGTQGNNSSFFSFTAIGGGYGNGSNTGGAIGGPGGSGGGGGGTGSAAGGAGTSGQGNAGGATSGNGGAGGGGAGAVGGSFPGGGGIGGVGLSSSITGSALYYAGGGGGSFDSGPSAGGSGGGGIGSTNSVAAGAGGNNTGGGGGGGSFASPTVEYGASGGSGVVIISYPSATQKGTGGVVTAYSANGLTYWVHTFNSSGIYIS